MAHLEIEFKTLLNKKTFDRLRDTYFVNASLISQENIYIDTDDFDLRRNRMMLRVRVIDETHIMTLKKPVSGGILEFDGTIEEPINSNLLKQMPQNIADELNAHDIDISALKVQGSLHTERLETAAEVGLLVLDKSTYLNTVDYELEFEAHEYDSGEIYFKQFLERNQIETRSDLPKSERFYRTLYKEKVE